MERSFSKGQGSCSRAGAPGDVAGKFMWMVTVTHTCVQWGGSHGQTCRDAGLWTAGQTQVSLQCCLNPILKETAPFQFEKKLQIPLQDRKWLIWFWSSTQKIANICVVHYSLKTISYLSIMRKMLLPLSKETESLISLIKFHRQNKIKSCHPKKGKVLFPCKEFIKNHILKKWEPKCCDKCSHGSWPSVWKLGPKAPVFVFEHGVKEVVLPLGRYDAAHAL